MAACADPSGAVFYLWQAGTHRGAEAVNEPCTWNWSELNTRDIDGVKAFYGSVFGWEADTLDLGFGESTVIRLPGYADFLDRFADDVPSHWSVTFSVADSDAVATTAVQLGGRVLTPPFDAGPVRAAVLSDPEGGVFTVSAYSPDEPS
jgi:hypothetical protein